MKNYDLIVNHFVLNSMWCFFLTFGPFDEAQVDVFESVDSLKQNLNKTFKSFQRQYWFTGI